MFTHVKCHVPIVSAQDCYLENTPVQLCRSLPPCLLPLFPYSPSSLSSPLPPPLTLFFCVSLPPSLSCVCLFGICARYFPSQSACTQKAPSPWRTTRLPPQPPSSSHPATLTPSHPHPALPRVLLSNCPPQEPVPVSANQIEGTYFLNRVVAQRGDIAFSTVEPAFTYGVHTLPQVIEPAHCTCTLWRIEPFDQSPCRLICSM